MVEEVVQTGHLSTSQIRTAIVQIVPVLDSVANKQQPVEYMSIKLNQIPMYIKRNFLETG